MGGIAVQPFHTLYPASSTYTGQFQNSWSWS